MTNYMKDPFFWEITRYTKLEDQNMVLENVAQQVHMTLTLPDCKRRKIGHVPWDSADLPGIPLMVNPKAISKHKLLQIFMAPQEKNSSPGKNNNE